jgi:hypothetical protein
MPSPIDLAQERGEATLADDDVVEDAHASELAARLMDPATTYLTYFRTPARPR